MIDANILLRGGVPRVDIANPLLGAARAKEEIQGAPIRREANQIALDNARQGQNDQQVQRQLQQQQILAQHFQNLQRIPDVNQRYQANEEFKLRFEKIFPGSVDSEPDDLSDNGIQSSLAALKSFNPRGQQLTAGQIDRMERDRALQGAIDPETGQLYKDRTKMTPEGEAEAIRRQLISGRSTSEAITLAGDEALTQRVADVKEEIYGAQERGKIKVKTQLLPELERKVAIARKEAEARGETLTDLKRMNATLPQLRETVEDLRELGQIATSTIGGKIFDTAVKEFGFGSTKGATARAKFIAVVNNQVLPLLKPTFGGSFTIQEGEALKATLGDPNASPEEKMAQLDAFIKNKEREIRSAEAELGMDQPGQDSGGIPEVTTQEQYDALPSGAVFTEDGVQYRKP